MPDRKVCYTVQMSLKTRKVLDLILIRQFDKDLATLVANPRIT